MVEVAKLRLFKLSEKLYICLVFNFYCKL